MLTLQELAELVAEHRPSFTAQVKEFEIDGIVLPFNTRPAIMGVINLSPDSWYRESVCLSTDHALERGQILHQQGAALVDVGAESTLPNAERVGAAAQTNQLLPVIKGLTEAKVPVSIETYDPTVAAAALKNGAAVLNLTGPGQSQAIYRLVAEHHAAVIICYVQADHVRAAEKFTLAHDPIPLMRDYFARQIELATATGVEKIFLDPGLGFYYANLKDSAVRVRHQINTFLNSFRLRSLGFPICNALPHAFEFFAEEVRVAEPVFAVLAALGKTDLFRTHEVPRVRAVLDLLAC